MRGRGETFAGMTDCDVDLELSDEANVPIPFHGFIKDTATRAKCQYGVTRLNVASCKMPERKLVDDWVEPSWTDLPLPNTQTREGSQDAAAQAAIVGMFRSSSHVLSAERPVRLLDVNLIIVGTGAEAIELLRRRRACNGRALLLWTDAQAARPVPPKQTVYSSSVQFEMSSFLWNPPQSSKPTASKEIADLRHKFSSETRGLCKFGPDILELGSDESYEVILNSQGQPSGVRVCNNYSLVWEMSGVVLLVGKHFGDCSACTSMSEASSIDVDVLHEELKPFASVQHKHVIIASVIYFVQLFGYSVLMNVNERSLQFGQPPWWRVFFSAGTPFFGYGIIPDIFGYSLFGLAPSKRISFVCAFLAWPCFSLLYFIPAGNFDGISYVWPIFMICVLGTVFYLMVTFPLYIIWACRTYTRLRVAIVGIAWMRHFAWMTWLLAGSLGSWIVLYSIALFYLFLSRYASVVAAILLPLMTTACEQLFASINQLVYNKVIFRVARSEGGRKQVMGYQRRHLVTVMMFTHAFAESTRLVSLIADEVREPGYAWITSLIMGLVIEVVIRTGNLDYFKVIWCPKRMRKYVKLSASKVLHNDCKFSMGYPRFVSTFAFLFAELLVFGPSGRRIFTNGVIVIVIVSLAVEVVTDAIVTKNLLLPLHPWRSHVVDVYKPLSVVDPRQLFATDSNGLHIDRPSLGFHGMTSPTAAATISIMGPACYFSYCLYMLLLGAGFVHGVCDHVLPDSLKLIDGLVWQTPLTCG
eukprot:TRINITY_DN64004_c0_g1_i1.p1 TRINITY_DN64004_c0_g1~~TRINITY_DN64004_c0_g1_i1.p1  ORF type:complete len:754 (+),score=47.84 TRINITY_DN64004_c0_g1_i1:79-2340(+)